MLDKFPRIRRYSLGEKIERGLIEILEALLNATYSSGSQRTGALQRANRKLAVVRHLLRLSAELQVCSTGTYEHGARLISSLGRQIGGWQSSAVTS